MLTQQGLDKVITEAGAADLGKTAACDQVVARVNDPVTGKPQKQSYVRVRTLNAKGLELTIEVDHVDPDGQVRTDDEIAAIVKAVLVAEGGGR